MAHSEKFKTLFDPATYECCRNCSEPLEGKVCPSCGGDHTMKPRLLYTSEIQREIYRSYKRRTILKQVYEGRRINPDKYFEFK